MSLVELAIIRNKALLIIFACNILFHSLIDVSSSNFLFQELPGNTQQSISLIQGGTLLLFPLLGWLAEVYLSRYTALKCAPVLSFLGALSAAIGLIIIIQLGLPRKLLAPDLLVYGGFLFAIMGSGLFEANALQFGLDQLLDAPSDHLSAFIHWYFWGIHFIQVLSYLPHLVLTIAEQHSACEKDDGSAVDLQFHFRMVYTTEILVFVLAQFLLTCFVLIILQSSKSYLTIQPAGTNPFKKVYQVLKYTWKHKIPERRSAFTYWEEDVPARIDVGKKKYGGPFSNEEVEDTKTFIRLLLVILSLIGLQMSNDGFSTVEHVMSHNFCPSMPVFSVIGMNAKFLMQVVIVLGIPLYRLILLPVFKHSIPRMMRKMWMGIVLSFLQVSVYFMIYLFASSTRSLKWTNNQLLGCFQNQSYSLNASGACVPPFSPPSDGVFLWMILPQVLGGLSYMLVFVTTLEFLCAQSPRTMQGMFIGFWYSTGVIKYALMLSMDFWSTYNQPAFVHILYVTKVCSSFASVLMYSLVSRMYRYRERDEAINFQAIVEDQYEREIEEGLLREAEDKALLQYSSLSSRYGSNCTTMS